MEVKDIAIRAKEEFKQTEVGNIPKDWNVLAIADLTPKNKKYGIVDGPFGSNLKTIHYRKSGVPIITSGYVTDGKFNAKEYLYVDEDKFKQEKRSAVSAGDIVMAKIGERCGASAILPNNHPVGILSGNALKISIDESSYSTNLIWQILWNKHSIGDLEVLRTTGAQPALSIANLKKYPIPLPPTKAEQTAIATVLSDTDALISRLETLIEKKRAIKQGAMQQLLKPKEGWEVNFLTEYVHYIHGKAHEKDINDNGKYIVVNSKFVSSEGNVCKYSNINYCPARKDDILTVLSDLPNGKALAKCFFIESNDKYAVNQRVCIWRSKGADPKFLYYILNRNKYFLALDDGVSQTHILNHHIKNCQISVPINLSEQTRIAQILSDMDAEIAGLEQKLAKYKLVKQGMMQELLTGKTRLV